MLLFLGAGASKPFGIPDMKELTNKLLIEFKDQYPEKNSINEITDRVKKLGIIPDIEAILTCVDALNNPAEGIKNAGAFAAYLSKLSRPQDALYYRKEEHYKKLSKDIREIIRKYCFLPQDESKIKDILKIYDNLFACLSFSFTNELTVFTTNYDYCFETYCCEKQYDFFDGFEPQMGIQTYIGMDESNKKLKICKLHGSSNYVITARNKLVKTDQIVKPNSRTTSGKIVKESMIYPTTEKYFSRDPYFGLLSKFRNDLIAGVAKKEESIIVIIGYSFRDFAINNAFIDALNAPIFKRKIIFFVNPFAKTIISNNIPQLSKIIEPINKRFEDITKSDFSKV